MLNFTDKGGCKAVHATIYTTDWFRCCYSGILVGWLVGWLHLIHLENFGLWEFTSSTTFGKVWIFRVHQLFKYCFLVQTLVRYFFPLLLLSHVSFYFHFFFYSVALSSASICMNWLKNKDLITYTDLRKPKMGMMYN